ncbi:MAG: cation transporter [Desulfurococcales archaeon ex4484_58]|nr:MAG: cation transporter [Desulfurococcales archaeon ex4484_58]
MNIKIYLILILGFTGGLVKILGSILHGSRSLFVDALTSFANLVSLLATIYFYRVSRMPPDHDHPYGHYRLGFGGSFVSLIAYGYVAGIASMELLYSIEYTVELESLYYALAGLLLYGLAIYLSLEIGGFFKAYGLFTISELYESMVTLIAVVAGALYSYLIDYIGAIGLTLYIFYELFSIGRETFYSMIDKTAPQQLLEEVKRVFEEMGFQITDLRIRCIASNIYHGDIRIKMYRTMDLNNAYRLIKELKKYLKEKYNLELVVEIDLH